MGQKIDVPLPEDLVIGDSWTVVWDAVDPTTGASVSGVSVSEANISAADDAGGGFGGSIGPFMLVPGPET